MGEPVALLRVCGVQGMKCFPQWEENEAGKLGDPEGGEPTHRYAENEEFQGNEEYKEAYTIFIGIFKAYQRYKTFNIKYTTFL